MRTAIFILFSILFVKNSDAQYISEIIEYTPAPGQFINTESFGNPAAAQSIIGGTDGLVSLGAFGGYLIFKFENPVENNPDNPYGIDFTVFGNASGENAEPATVFVMKDENNNGLPDDTWYELAGSDYYFSTTIKNYEISYTNPHQSVAADVLWTDNQDSSGYIFANEYHTQAYYPAAENFPNINQDNYTLSGTKITAAVDLSNTTNIRSYKRAFGYADNCIRGNMSSTLPDNPYTSDIENMGGDSFDISWAVDENGNYFNLDEIDFIKIQTCVNANMLWLGELSAEISGAVDIAPDASISGQENMVVIKDLPPILYVGSQYPIETFAFDKGHLLTNQNIDISTDLQGATVDENNILDLSQPGTLTLTASFSDNPAVASSITLQVSEPENITAYSFTDITLFPNPADNFFQIKGLNHANISITDSYGKKMMEFSDYVENKKLNISQLKAGVYILNISENHFTVNKKIIVTRH